jgi:hypothetical protein
LPPAAPTNTGAAITTIVIRSPAMNVLGAFFSRLSAMGGGSIG